MNNQVEESVKKNEELYKRSDSSLLFDEYIENFHIYIAEGKYFDALITLDCLEKDILTNSSNINEKDIRKEIIFSCKEKAKSYSNKMIENLREYCKKGDDVEALNTFSALEKLGYDYAYKGANILMNHLSVRYEQRARNEVGRPNTMKGTKGSINEFGYQDRRVHLEAFNEIMRDVTSIISVIIDTVQDIKLIKLIIDPLHEECINKCLELLKIYNEDARIVQWEKKAVESPKPDLTYLINSENSYQQYHYLDKDNLMNTNVTIEQDESIRMVDLLLDEIVYLLHVWKQYLIYISSLKNLLSDNKQILFENKLREIATVYVLLERFYIFQTSYKATYQDEPQEIESNIFASGAVEDICFVLDKSFSRASQTLNHQSTVAITTAIIDTIETIYLPSILSIPYNTKYIVPPALLNSEMNDSDKQEENKAEESSSVHLGDAFTDALLQAVDQDLSKFVIEEAKLFITINSAHLSQNYLLKLQETIYSCSKSLFPNDTNILECVPHSLSSTVNEFTSIIENGLQEFIDNKMKNDIMNHLSTLLIQTKRTKYDTMTLQEYDYYDANGSALTILIKDKIIRHEFIIKCQRHLIKEVFSFLIQKLCLLIASEIQNGITYNKFNDYGAMQLEREMNILLRSFMDIVSDTPITENTGNNTHGDSIKLQSKQSIRSCFTKLDQIVLLLNILNLNNLIEYKDILLQHLTPDEIETFLGLKKSFNKENIKKIVNQFRSS